MSKQSNRTRGLTLGKVKQFIKRRNTSPFDTNLQFQIDADASGFSVDELGKPEYTEQLRYIWTLPFGKLVEYRGKLTLYDTDGTFLYGYRFLDGSIDKLREGSQNETL